jgi:SAM-dependent methyltransferase
MTTKPEVQTIAATEAAVWDGSAYYDHADAWTWVFWHENHPFRPFFNQLDTSNLLELACGHGRHGKYILENISGDFHTFIMMDILQSNIDFCIKNIPHDDRLQILCNNGTGFQAVDSASITAVFCYDAMVHFHRDVVKSYLQDTFRILRPGGKGLFHHSNYTLNPDISFAKNPHARAFMSAALFASIAIESGLEVVEQKLLRWGEIDELDCLSLVRRPL